MDADGELLKRVAAAVRGRRKALGLTARATAEAAGLSLRFYTDLEAGRANIALTRLAGVARALDVPPSSLLAAPQDGEDGRGRIDRLLAGRTGDELDWCARVLESALGQSTSAAVALLGLRGAGKSTLGPLIARSLGVAFVELDDHIEEAAGLSLGEIFTLHGETYYRRLASRCLTELLTERRASVIALPGGIVNDSEAFSLVCERCTTVWLHARPEDHVSRVLQQGDRRPLADRPDAMAELVAILESRRPLYAQAQIDVDTSRQGVDEAVRTVLADLERAGWRAA